MTQTRDQIEARSQAMIAEASEWFVRLRDPSCSADSVRAFERWLEADPAHRKEFEQIGKTWRDVAAVEGEATLLADARVRLQAHREGVASAGRPAVTSRRDWLAWLKIPALAVAVLVLAYGGNAWFAANVATFKSLYITAVGENRVITLEDGTKIVLNTDSRLRVTLYPSHRETTLERGEAWFEVAHDSLRPFRVAAGVANVEVVGTRFAVRNATDSLDVTVEDGTVRVSRTDAPSETMTLIRGQGIQIARDNVPLHVTAVDVEQYTSWRTGNLVVSARPLGEVVADLSRYRRTAIRVSPEAARLPITAVINIRNADEWLAALPGTLPIRASRDRSGDWDIALATGGSAEAPIIAPRRAD